MSDLSSLIERVEAATEGSRELDGAICLAFGWTHQKMKGDSKPYYRKPGETTYYMRSTPPKYTTSIDDALTLLPEGYAVTNLMIWPEEPSSATVVGTTRRPFGKDHRMSWIHGAGDGTWRGNGATAPLALLAAILRARQAADTES